MRNILRIISVGFLYFSVIFLVIIALVFIKARFYNINFDLIRVIPVALKGGGLAAIVMMIIFSIGGPRRRTPGGH